MKFAALILLGVLAVAALANGLIGVAEWAGVAAVIVLVPPVRAVLRLLWALVLMVACVFVWVVDDAVKS